MKSEIQAGFSFSDRDLTPEESKVMNDKIIKSLTPDEQTLLKKDINKMRDDLCFEMKSRAMRRKNEAALAKIIARAKERSARKYKHEHRMCS